MRVAIIENTPVTHYGLVGQALMEAAAQIRQFLPREGHALPEVAEFDALVVFGGEQAATEDGLHPYLADLAARMRAYVEADKAVLGICLGAQLMARGFGAQNYIGTHPERGWTEITLSEAGRQDPFFAGTGAALRSFALHSDHYALPEGAVLLASSAAAPHQAFRLGRAGYGTQFHFEASRPVVADLTRRFRSVFEDFGPGWDEAHAQEAQAHGAAADAAGLQLARNWVSQIRS